ncbi:ribose-phosphate diphosphokinase [Candidatus Woesearchaeota archaeon]|nr:ribose-phosphate diphosphokinase [Candidatus Woesearchaeota archaeon]
MYKEAIDAAGFTSKKERNLAEDILSSLEPNWIVLYGRGVGPFAKRLEKFYGMEKEAGLNVMERLLNQEDMLSSDRIRYLKKAHSRLLDLEFGAGELYIKNHDNVETYVKSLSNLRGRKVDVVFTFPYQDPDHQLVELILIGDTLVRTGINFCDLYLLWIPYMREDKKDEGRVPISAKAIFNTIKEAFKERLRRVVTMDLHASQEQGFIDKPVDHITFRQSYAEYLLSEKYKADHPGGVGVVAALDAGGAKSAEKLAKLFSTKEKKIPSLVLPKKEREEHGIARIDPKTAADISSKVKGKNVAAIEDMIGTGGSIDEANKIFMECGANSFTVGAAHGFFNNKKDENGNVLVVAEERLRKTGARIVIADTVPREMGYYEKNKDWLTPLTEAHYFAQVMIANRLNFSISKIIRRKEEAIRHAVETGKPTDISDLLLF